MKDGVTLLITSLTFVALSLSMANQTAFAQTAPPPSIGQDTKGEPAVKEPEPQTQTEQDSESSDEATEDGASSPFGTAKITESRRESGQVYLIELEHSSGAKQYIEENDSDGNIESQKTDIEDTPNLPKWRLGSW